MTDEIQKVIQELSDRNGGRVTPDEVISHARDPASPLHSHFNWDVEKAAHEHWRNTARHIIASVRVNITTERTVMRSVAYVRDPAVPADEQGYISVVVLRDDSAMSEKAFVNELSRAEAALNRATELAAALNLEPEVRRLSRRVSNLKNRVTATA